MSVPTFTKAGAKASVAAKLSKEVFGVEVTNHELIKEAYLMYLANARQNNAKVKNRGDVSGGGKKPWRQKGTGRARFGSSRNPIWRGGGVAFGPTGNENYVRRMSLTAKRQAIRQALSLKAAAGAVIVMEDISVKDAKTKAAAELLAKVGAKGNTLVVVDVLNQELSRAMNNLSRVMVVRADRLNTYDLMNADSIVISQSAVKAVEAWLGGTK